MAATMNGVLDDCLRKTINQCKLLVVGAGGIGCELIKNLVLTGFHDIELIDLDTIDVSNLNRQFLFRKEHVGKSKAQVARESVLKFNPKALIVAYHDSIMSTEYGVEFFKKFNLVMNALDNRAARNHVNRMCLAANIPLIESGTAGYLGQVTVIKKGLTECYECQPKPTQKSFPGCTIRNTPSEAIHCIVWAKHLFNQLFGEEDPDQDVSPDTADPEAAGGAGEVALQSTAGVDAAGGVARKSTRAWAVGSNYDPIKLFTKLFNDDIKYLLSMKNLWKKRQPPNPLDFDDLPDEETPMEAGGMRDQQVWSVCECASQFSDSVIACRDELHRCGEGDTLVWDKDDEAALTFVTSAANLRSHIFHIARKSKFDVKSMAGHIIPAIATTNAIIAGLLVMEGLKILQGRIDLCKTVYLNRQPNPRKKLLVPCVLDKPNPKCYVCSEKPEVCVKLNTKTVSVRTLADKIIKENLGMVAPDVEIDDGKGTILISSEDGETDEVSDRPLSDFGIRNGSVLKCDDFLQAYNLNVNIIHVEKLEEEQEFEVIGDVSELRQSASSDATSAEVTSSEVATSAEIASSSNGSGRPDTTLDEDDLMIVEDDDAEAASTVKRKASDTEDEDGRVTKKLKSLAGGDAAEQDTEDVIVL